MARVQFAAPITTIKGSIGGWTFHKNRSGNIIRLRGQASKEATPKQTAAQELHQKFLQQFQKLSLTSKEAWDAFSLTFTKENKFGEVKTLTGQNWFESVNQNRELVQESILQIPPDHLIPVGVPATILTIDETAIKLDVATGTDLTDIAFIIRTTFPHTRTTTSVRSALRLTKIITTATPGIIDLTTDWETTHNLQYPPSAGAACFTITTMIQTLQKESGITSPGLILFDDLRIPLQGIGAMQIGTTFVVS